MASLNKIMLIGNLCRDMEKRDANGSEVSSNTIAVTERFKNKQGETQEKTEFINLVFWRRQSEIACQYLKKGSSIYVEGKYQTQSWEKDGQKHYKTEVVVSNFQMLGSKGEQSAPSKPTPQQAPQIDDVPPYDSELPF